MKYSKIVTALAVAMQFVVTAPSAWAQQAQADKTIASLGAAETKPVTWDNFVRAESDK